MGFGRDLQGCPDIIEYRPQREHTEIEEELHEVAHIDYDRVSIVSVPLNWSHFFRSCITDSESFRGRAVRGCIGV